MFRSATLVAVGSLVGLLAPHFVQDPHAQGHDKQDKGTAAPQEPGQQAPAKKTNVHATFAALVGEYDVALKLSMGGKVMETKGTSKLSVVADGRFILEENAGELMGKKFTGVRFYGWNAEAKVFEGTWAYSESNAIMRLTGKAASDRKSIEFEATAQESVDVKGKYAIKAERAEGGLKFTMTHFGPDGKAAGTLEETYTKKK